MAPGGIIVVDDCRSDQSFDGRYKLTRNLLRNLVLPLIFNWADWALLLSQPNINITGQAFRSLRIEPEPGCYSGVISGAYMVEGREYL
jgi:hypothetical protein